MSEADRYRRVARAYARLGELYSGGAIEACKRSFIADVGRGERVLFAGAGIGSDVVEAVRRGARVTAVDNSPAMIEQIRTRLDPGAPAELVCADLFDMARAEPFDWVIANFFLNVFPAHRLLEVIRRLAGFLRDGARLVIGDFAPPSARGWERALQQLHYGLPLSIFWMTTGAPLHRLHDYRPYLAAAGLQLLETRTFRVFGMGPGWYTAYAVRRS